MRSFLAIALLLTAALHAACGVAFGDPPEGNEFFQSLDVTGERRAGEPMTAAVDYESFYPVRIDVVCELRQDKSLVKQIGAFSVPPLPGGNPDATPFPGNYAFDFVVDSPGRYKVECLTPKDEDNFIVEEFTIRSAAGTGG